MNWLICGAWTTATAFLLMTASAITHRMVPPEAAPVALEPITIPDFNLISGAPLVAANSPRSNLSFELVAMTEPHSPAPSTIRARQMGPVAAPKPQTEVLASKERSRRVLYFTGPSCGHCQAWDQTTKQDLLKAGWQIDSTPSAHVQVVDAFANPELVDALGVSALPTFVLQVNGTAEATHIGPISAWGLAEFYRPRR